jgi:cytochrome P450
MTQPPPLPVAEGPAGLEILKGLLRDRSLLTALTLMYQAMGSAFQITLPRFKPAVMVGAETNRQILVSKRGQLLWRSPSDPVTRLLRRGLLVVDGAEHDGLRSSMEPLLQRREVYPHIPAFWTLTDQVSATWQPGETRDMLVEMRKIALLIIFDTLFRVDLTPALAHLWQPILDLIHYISPGWWIIFPNLPRHPKYRRAQQAVDTYLYGLIKQRRDELQDEKASEQPADLLTTLVSQPDLTDDLIRDQLLTMLIAGHDTSTALLAWSLYLLGNHPEAMRQVQEEVDRVLGDSDIPPTIEQINALVYTEQVIKEALRLYPPIHVGNRRVAQDLTLHGYHVPQDTRLMYSIYLSHREPANWPDPEVFCPARFERQVESARPPFSYIPFGGGPRNCIGAAFAQVEARVVLGRLVQRFDLELLEAEKIKPYMGATLEPRPGVKMVVQVRSGHA